MAIRILEATSIVTTYFAPLAILVGYFADFSIFIPLAILAVAVSYLMSVRNNNGRKKYTVDKLHSIGLFFYFPISMAFRRDY